VKDDTLKASNKNFDSYDSDDENSTVDEYVDFVSKLHESGDAGESEEFFLSSSGLTPRISLNAPPPPPPLRHINENDTSPFNKSGKSRLDYDKSRKPQKSSMRKPNSKNRNIHSIDNTQHGKSDVTRGISRNHSADGTEDTRRGSGSLHSVRMRGSIYPVHRRQSIGFEETVRVQKVTSTVDLNDGNFRELWLQADEAMEIKERRRSLLKRYKEREAKKKKEAAERIQKERIQKERIQKERIQQEREKALQQQQKAKNKNSLNNFLSQHSAPKNQPNVHSPSGRRWKATIKNDPASMGLSVPIRGREDRSSVTSSLYMGSATSSFVSTSSGGSSLSGHDSDSFRGLEKYIDRSGKHQKNMVWDAVFIEQDEQLQFGYYDDERIANLYRSVQSQHDGQQKAEGRARKDRKAANNYLMTPRTLKLLKKTINVNTNDISSLSCSDLLQDDTDANKGATYIKKKSGLGNHGKNNTEDNSNTGATAKTTKLKSSGNRKLHNKFLRRLSV
jgi:hypothetical protein